MEEELAAATLLFGRDRASGHEPPERVPMQPQILRCLARIEPFVRRPRSTVAADTFNDRRRQAVSEMIDQHVDHRAVVVGEITQAAPDRLGGSERRPRSGGSTVGLQPTSSNIKQLSRSLALLRRVR